MSQRLYSKCDDEALAIRTLYQQKIDGWNAKSGEAFSAPNTEDSDHIGFGCTYLKGRLEIASFHRDPF